MTSVWSNAEQIYSMPGAGAAASAPGAVSVILSGNSATLPAFKMPSLRALWGMTNLPGRSLGVRARGNFGTPASSPGTWVIGCGLNTTQATKPAATVLVASGAFTLASPNLGLASTAGEWELEFDVNVQSVGTNAGATPAANIWAGGTLSLGPAAATAGGISLNVGMGAATAIDPTAEYWVELYATFSTGPTSTSLQAQQFFVWAWN